jgi:hypothetical protein
MGAREKVDGLTRFLNVPRPANLGQQGVFHPGKLTKQITVNQIFETFLLAALMLRR